MAGSELRVHRQTGDRLRKDYLGESSLGKNARRGILRAEEAVPQLHSGIALQSGTSKPAAPSQSRKRNAFAVKAS
ncbi:MAG: hypothetical protein ACREV4_08170 [Gammaproteobacteria bacterium]